MHAEVRRRFRAEEVFKDNMVTAKRLHWVGHVTRMDNFWLPEKFLFA